MAERQFLPPVGGQVLEMESKKGLCDKTHAYLKRFQQIAFNQTPSYKNVLAQ